MLASTQTAVILAELEVNAGSSGDLDLTCSGFCPDSPVKVQVMNLPIRSPEIVIDNLVL